MVLKPEKITLLSIEAYFEPVEFIFEDFLSIDCNMQFKG